MSDMALVSPTMMAAMMVAMMLPSFAPAIWLYARAAGRGTRAAGGLRALLFALGYVCVWTVISAVLYMLSERPIAPAMASVVVLSAGIVQCTRWKARRLTRCRDAMGSVTSGGAMTALRHGWRFGVDCGLSCAALTAILFVVGLMDMRAMTIITIAITAERLAPMGARIARVTGTGAICAGVVMCMHVMR